MQLDCRKAPVLPLAIEVVPIGDPDRPARGGEKPNVHDSHGKAETQFWGLRLVGASGFADAQHLPFLIRQNTVKQPSRVGIIRIQFPAQ